MSLKRLMPYHPYDMNFYVNSDIKYRTIKHIGATAQEWSSNTIGIGASIEDFPQKIFCDIIFIQV